MHKFVNATMMAVALYAGLAEAKGVRLRASVDAPLHANGDRHRLAPRRQARSPVGHPHHRMAVLPLHGDDDVGPDVRECAFDRAQIPRANVDDRDHPVSVPFVDGIAPPSRGSMRVAASVAAMRRATDLPVTVKCRIGIDDQDTEESLDRFADTMVAAGVDALYVHARKAWLKGLSPKENREVPPLRYELAYQLKRDFPHLTIGVNGGITSNEQIDMHLAQVDGVMVGREAYHHPWLMTSWDERFFGASPSLVTREGVEEQMVAYMEREHAALVVAEDVARAARGLRAAA